MTNSVHCPKYAQTFQVPSRTAGQEDTQSAMPAQLRSGDDRTSGDGLSEIPVANYRVTNAGSNRISPNGLGRFPQPFPNQPPPKLLPAPEVKRPPSKPIFERGPRVYFADLDEFGVSSGFWPFGSNRASCEWPTPRIAERSQSPACCLISQNRTNESSFHRPLLHEPFPASSPCAEWEQSGPHRRAIRLTMRPQQAASIGLLPDD